MTMAMAMAMAIKLLLLNDIKRVRIKEANLKFKVLQMVR